MAFIGAGMGKKGILSCDIKSVTDLHKLYMPFIENSGIFVKTKNQYKLGEEVFLLLSLMEEEKFPITGKVIWVTPSGASGLRHPGIGVQFSDNSDMEQARTKIETMLAPFKGEQIATETM
ncbi:MAG: PilZ domain-containing protein [Proteobacteria bacterium]|nr:PilZ domain-containing protein [Pseudomonadota bacterium]